ncbi:S-layer homology domain-containing protein [Candidatus Peribacteria bacterium]|nr:S-layer homology domain-containing protein [Candidatus Peribacteria bacterium]
MHYDLRTSVRVSVALYALLWMPLPLLAQEDGSSVGTATIAVEQEGPDEDIAGSWSMLTPDQRRLEMGTKASHTFKDAVAGQYTILATPPSGASATIAVTTGEAAPQITNLPQVSFPVLDGTSVRVAISFTYTSVGKISVQSSPLGLSFSMKGPDGKAYEGVTPQEYLGAPIGLYSLTFDPIEGCISPKPKSDQLTKNGRITFSISVVCDALKDLPVSKEMAKTLEFVSATVGDEHVTFTDVPLSAWFATYVNKAIRSGIMSGYRSQDGTLSGAFGPGDSVTLSQLAKVAHKIGNIDEMDGRSLPQNSRARDTWFSDVYASAERRNWSAYRNIRENPERPATRAEVVCTLLQALDVPRLWAKGTRFPDLPATHPYADCVETAAQDGLVSGDASSETFDPDRPINRAELSKILVTAMEIYKENTEEIRGNYDGMQ